MQTCCFECFNRLQPNKEYPGNFDRGIEKELYPWCFLTRQSQWISGPNLWANRFFPSASSSLAKLKYLLVSLFSLVAIQSNSGWNLLIISSLVALSTVNSSLCLQGPLLPSSALSISSSDLLFHSTFSTIPFFWQARKVSSDKSCSSGMLDPPFTT